MSTFIPNFNPFMFSRLSPRERMIQQLQGRGLGSVGLVQMLQGTNGGGQAGFLVGTNHLGFEFDPRAAMEPGAPSAPGEQYVAQTFESRLEPRPYVAPEQGSRLSFNRMARDTSGGARVLDTPSPSTTVEETPQVPSIPDTDALPPMPTGTRVNPEDVMKFPEFTPEQATPWTTAPHGEPLYVKYDDDDLEARGGHGPELDPNIGVGVGPGAPAVAAEQAALVTPSGGVPWWGWALGAAAVGFGIYKLGGRKR